MFLEFSFLECAVRQLDGVGGFAKVDEAIVARISIDVVDAECWPLSCSHRPDDAGDIELHGFAFEWSDIDGQVVRLVAPAGVFACVFLIPSFMRPVGAEVRPWPSLPGERAFLRVAAQHLMQEGDWNGAIG